MPQANSDLFVKFGLNVGQIANIAGNTFVRQNLTVSNTLTTSDATATHVLAGGMTVDDTTLIVNRVGKRVGIGGDPDEAKLKVFGELNVTEDTTIDMDLSVGGMLAVTGETSLAAKLTSKQIEASENVTFKKDVIVDGNITMAPGKTVDGVDISALKNSVENAAILRVYDSAGNLIFPNE